MLPLFALVLAVITSAVQEANPCELLDRAAVSALLGPSVTDGTLVGPEPDEDSGGTLSYCTYRGGAAALIVSQVTFVNAAAARKATTKELVAGRLEDEVTTLTEEAGVGEKAFWACTGTAAEYVVLRGSEVLGLALGGKLPKAPESYHAALRAAAASASARL